jgi:hypothetical protein
MPHKTPGNACVLTSKAISKAIIEIYELFVYHTLTEADFQSNLTDGFYSRSRDMRIVAIKRDLRACLEGVYRSLPEC